jgi:AdoMet-dependent rRNA methyltransferase SPB1
LETENPYAVFAEFNEILVSQEDRDNFFGLTKVPEELDVNIKDIKVLGKREVMQIVKLRDRINLALKKIKRF